MPKKDFYAQVGQPPKGVVRAKDGKLTSSRSERGRKLAMDLLEDPEYRKTLRERLMTGTAGPIEVHLWRMAYGEPQKDDSGKAAEEARFAAMREQLGRFLREKADEARTLNAVVTRAPRVLELPRPILDVKPLGDDERPA
jgi:hypothetical protein